jgi:glutaminase
MRTPVPEYLQDVLDQCWGGDTGHVADYIPELAAADPDRLAAAVATLDGPVHTAGDADVRFTIQSVSKPFAYALALRDRGLDDVLVRVGVEPSGDAFNEVSLEPETGRPRNPMINVGAIVTHSLVGEPEVGEEERTEAVVDGLSAFAGRRLEVDEAVYVSELDTAHRNLALAHMVRSHGVVQRDPVSLVRGYTRQCSVLVDVRDLAVMAATLANGGVNPITGVTVVPAWVARQVLSVMATCGMYDAAGDWFTSIGIPAKSGVSGAIIGALPGEVGIGVLSPRLDRFGNSVRGVRICERLSRDMGLHLMASPASGANVIRHFDADGGTVELALQGGLHYATAEHVLNVMSQVEADDRPVTLDLSRVTVVNDVADRMLREGIRRLGLDGHDVSLVAPEHLARRQL